MAVARKDVKVEDQWNLESLYPSLDAWQKDLKSFISSDVPPFFSKLCVHKGKLSESADRVKDTLIAFFEAERKLRKLYTYAHLLHDQETTVEEAKVAYNTIMGIYHQFSQELAWFQPEILGLDEALLQKYLQAPELKEYHFFLEKLARLKPHTLTSFATTPD